jgi:hypothetical protein
MAAAGRATAALAVRRQRWQHRGRALPTALQRRQERGDNGGGGISTPAEASLAAVAAAWHQRGVSGGGAINNQLKVSSATALETATMTATTKTIKMKATAAAAADWRLRNGGGGGSSAVVAVALGGDGSTAAEAVAARRWQRRRQLGDGGCGQSGPVGLPYSVDLWGVTRTPLTLAVIFLTIDHKVLKQE